MKLEFNSLTEIIDFLKEIGYTVEKQDFLSNEEFQKKLDEIKHTPARKLNDIPWNPFEPHYPSYPYPPITVTNEQIKEKWTPPQIQSSGDIK